MPEHDLPDISPAAVAARLRGYAAELRAKPEGEFRETDGLLLAMLEDTLAKGDRTDRELAEAEARAARLEAERPNAAGPSPAVQRLTALLVAPATEIADLKRRLTRAERTIVALISRDREARRK